MACSYAWIECYNCAPSPCQSRPAFTLSESLLDMFYFCLHPYLHGRTLCGWFWNQSAELLSEEACAFEGKTSRGLAVVVGLLTVLFSAVMALHTVD